MTEKDRRNLNPHAEAVLAMTMWGREYSQQRGGSMDFWDTLSDSRKQLCRDTVSKIKSTQTELAMLAVSAN